MTKRENFIPTLVGMRKDFDVKFLADTLSGLVFHAAMFLGFNTWIAFLVVPAAIFSSMASRSVVKKSLPKCSKVCGKGHIE